MGRILCQKHGRQGFYEVCEHISDEYEQDIYPHHRNFRLGDFYKIRVCDKCWKIHNLDRFQGFAEMSTDEFLDLDEEKAKSIEDEFNKIYDSVNPHHWCGQCVAEVQVKQARRNGESDPFSVFEKTLTDKQKETIEEIEIKLTDNFSFQESVFWKSQFQKRPAFSVQAGAYSYPLTIKIYYYVDEKEQNKIVDFVNEFLHKTELNQAKIEFWETENWIATENQYGLHNYHRGEEKLLREVYLNC